MTDEERLAREQKEARDKLTTRYVVTKPEHVKIDVSVLVETLYRQKLGYWEDTSGEGGTITTLNGMLVVRQTEKAHHNIEEFLNLLRQATIGQAQMTDSAK